MWRAQTRTLLWTALPALLALALGSAPARAQTDPGGPADRGPRREAPARPGAMPERGVPGVPMAGQDGPRAAKWLEGAFEGQPTTEAAEMLIAIARGSRMGPGDGWFHPGQSRYGWKWLAARHAVKPDGAIPRDKFLGPEAVFARLDRDRDGELRADDFDWSERSPYVQQARMTGSWFARINKAGDGRLTRQEWLRFFDEAAQGKDHLTPEDLWAGVFGGPRPRGTVNSMPSPEVLVRGVFRGELGSMQEGPKIDDPAPDFTLKTQDGKESIRLGSLLGKKPVVLVFGSFT